MQETCFTCEYKRLAREAIHDFRVLANCLGLIDDEIKGTWVRIVEGHRERLLALHAKQESEKEGNPYAGRDWDAELGPNCKMRLQPDGSIMNVG